MTIAEAKRIQAELDALGDGYAEDGIVRTVLRERVAQELRGAESLPEGVTRAELMIGETRITWPARDGSDRWDVWGPKSVHNTYILTRDTMASAIKWAADYEAARVRLAAGGVRP